MRLVVLLNLLASMAFAQTNTTEVACSFPGGEPSSIIVSSAKSLAGDTSYSLTYSSGGFDGGSSKFPAPSISEIPGEDGKCKIQVSSGNSDDSKFVNLTLSLSTLKTTPAEVIFEGQPDLNIVLQQLDGKSPVISCTVNPTGIIGGLLAKCSE